MTATGAAAYVPPDADLTQLEAASKRCHGCDLYRHATQTVFGEGPASAEIVLVGEQPGDREDLQGHPFVGPAGRLLDRALDQIGIDRDTVYLTNAVKHFKFAERGKRRIHQPPGRTEIVACAPWFDAELAVVRPRLVVCLGSIAAKALLGQSFRVTEHRGQLFTMPDYQVLTTVHPSSVLRSRDRGKAYADFVADLRRIATATG
ncbi:UdgX family uracil-DNA binding protein [Nocardia stercoris]|uniref:Type-4 uracil-DNA glycosylase n=1 Tax=Nocardia stercoris TaxID=2483361 RepID=A0A3M2L3I3_9NOCA|nr:UdgX family uracil-DNA binding protein [Nocardia stercoris]RMI31260.1 uracil-DNA glycosylase [Nocardia stercoris]